MSDTNGENEDDLYHYRMNHGPSVGFISNAKSLYYVENGNSPWGYSEGCNHFEMATRAILSEYKTSESGDWIGPLAHLGRQTLELGLKALVQDIQRRDSTVPNSVLNGHDLARLWMVATSWLDMHGFDSKLDSRRDSADRLITAYASIDPSGDLFRFGISRKQAFGKNKSYDRVGIILPEFEVQFDACIAFLQHWDAVVFRKTMLEEDGIKVDPYFDAADFPKA